MKYFGVEIPDLETYKKNRTGAIQYKDNAFCLQLGELDRMINFTKFSKRFLGKTQSWFSQRINGCDVNGEKAFFKEEEYSQIVNGYRELACQLNQYADELEVAKMWKGYERSIKG